MMICAWGLILFYSNSNSQRFQTYAGKMNAKRPTCPVGSIPSKAGTPQDRVWGHTRAKIFRCHVVAVTRAGDHAHAIIPVGTTVSVHGWLPSPFRVVTHIPLYCSRHREICQGNRRFVYNSFTCGGIMQEKEAVLKRKARRRIITGPKKNAPRSEAFSLYDSDQITLTRSTASSAVRSASTVAGTLPVTSKMV